ncbi:MAG: SufE family protein [Thermoanaerobaculia bacterium]
MSADSRTPPEFVELPELSDLVATLSGLDRSGRIEALIALSEGYREVSARLAQRPFPESHRVPACESQAFVFAESRPDGTLDFHFAVENPQGISAKALAAILARTLSGAPLAAIARLPVELVEQLFGRELSMGKSLGLAGMLLAVEREAREHLARGSGAAPRRTAAVQT